MKRYKTAKTAKKSSNINTLTIKIIVVESHCHYAGKYEVLHIAYIIHNIVYLKKFLRFLTID